MHQTILEINTADKEALPIIDMALFDMANSEKQKEFLIELSPVCFITNSAIIELENKLLVFTELVQDAQGPKT